MTEYLKKYAIWCETEGGYVYSDYRSEEPTVCPNNNTHTINISKTFSDSKLEIPSPTTVDGKPRFHETPRPLGTKTHFTSFGDDPNDPTDIGNGAPFELVHTIGGGDSPIYLDYNCVENITWICSGSITFEGCVRNKIVFDMVSRSTNCQPSETPTDYKLYGGIIFPADFPYGSSYVTVPDIIDGSMLHDKGLIYAPNNDLGEVPSAYWDATWDGDSTSFVNITPVPNGTGRYNMINYEKIFVRFVNKLLLGSQTHEFYSKDVDQLGHGVRFKITPITRGNDHNWSAVGEMLMYREKTI